MLNVGNFSINLENASDLPNPKILDPAESKSESYFKKRIRPNPNISKIRILKI